MDSTYAIGIGLFVAGLILHVLVSVRKRRSTVNANDHSVAVGGSNFGNINNVNSATSKSDSPGGGHHSALTLVAIVVELSGIAVTLWHAAHLAHRT